MLCLQGKIVSYVAAEAALLKGCVLNRTADNARGRVPNRRKPALENEKNVRSAVPGRAGHSSQVYETKELEKNSKKDHRHHARNAGRRHAGARWSG